MKKYWYSLTLGFITLFLFSSCTLFDVDLKTARNLEGEWEVTSFTIDGVETMASQYSRFVMEYEKYDKGNDEGDFTMTLTFVTGETSNLFGEYKIDDDGSNLELSFDSGVVENWNIDLAKDDLDMDAVLSGTSFVIKAERN